ncbi:MAG TPA: hypothetical protein PKW95_16015 [bacterium]|nr:hypothetical protein [bacterium]
MKRKDTISEVAEILATAIVRKRLRDVHNILKTNGKTEIGLEVSSGQSLHPVEPKRRRKK